jgi:peptidoglycan/xylan/chitin deacetylase (PgdA/CDA1 family)
MSSLPKSTPVQKQVSLTFDDGPSLRTTPRVLDILKKYKIPATFFVLGQRAQAHPQLIRRLIKEGHVVANHSYSHPQMTKLDSHAQIREIQKTHDAIAPLSTEPIKWFRPPYGSYNKKIEQLVAQKGMTVVLWNVDPQDWQRKKSSTDICHSVVDQVRPGSIILLHDIHERTVNALEKMIQSLLNKGYTFVPLRASK